VAVSLSDSMADKPTDSKRRSLSITVQNGNLSFVRQDLMLGHYTSSTLTGTEAVVDGLIGGTMAEALAMGCYPDRPGSNQVFLNTGIGRVNPLQPPKPESVIVVGLGEEGKLSAANLSYSVQMAVVAVAQRHMERLEGGERQFELASTLLGSGGSGIDAGQAAQLIAQGVRDANKLLRKQDRWPWVGTLHLVELYLDRASLALNALKVLAEAQPDDFEITPTVRAGQGWERRPLDWGYRGAGYDFISALTDNEAGTDSSSSVIRYTMDTHRARTEMHAQSSQRHLVEQLVAQASNEDCSDYQICRSLFKLLVPVELEPALGGTSAMVLELDQGTAPIPWEMLDYEGGSHLDPNHIPWAIRTKLLRKLQLAEFRQRPSDASRSSQALVIGEPLCDNPDLPRLPGARKESRAVRDKLQEVLGADRVMTLISPEANEGPGPDAVKVINTLMDRDWRIVHISGHGLLPEQGDPRGVVLSNGLYLGPREIHNMRVVPELVFVNCCHLAASAPERLMAKPYNRAKFAASLAEQLIHNGVRCVVAAGWAVADDPAETFAQQFYAALLSGQRFIDAVAIARKAAWRRSPDINTWAAYQCYGDPDWVFQAEGTDAQNPQPQNANQYAAVVSPSSLTLALESLTIKATTVQVPNTAATNKGNDLRQQLQDLEKRFESLWGSQGEVARCFGVAWDAAKDSDKAIAWYERALKAEDGGASLKSYEQLANLRVRQAWRQLDGAGRQLDEAGGAIPGQEITANASEKFQLKLQQARDEIQRGLEALQQLVAIGATMERLSLCGSAQKRLAMLERKAGDRAAEDKALQAMSDWYGRAEIIGSAGESADVFYPALNKMAAECVLHAGDTAWPGYNASHLVSLRQTLEQKRLNDPDFWSEIGVAELYLYEALAKRNLVTSLPAIRDEYARLHQRANDPRQWGSVCDQLDFVLPSYVERIAQTDPAEVEAAEALLAEVKGYAGG
jgi:tetratricopeptide (TPR) repeat protein